MAAYAEQILICTGKEDWKSRIEDEEDAVLVNQLKKNLTRGGKYVDPYHNVLITNSSFPPSNSADAPTPGINPPALSSTSSTTTSAFLLPSFTYIPQIHIDNPSSVETLIKAYLLPEKLHKAHSGLSPEQQTVLLRDSELQSHFTSARPITEILVLICGHGGRDERCGKLGPLLRDEFEDHLARQGINLLSSAPEAGTTSVNDTQQDASARVGLISHIGGHKWAGNVIVYVPPSLEKNALAGKGIWYGRVGPEHVEGIVKETVLEGKVIKELFRGGVAKDGEIIRI